MKKILITAIGGDVGYGLIKAIKESKHELYIIGCDVREYNMSRDVVDKFMVCPPFSKEKDWIKFVLNVMISEQIDYLWPVTENEIQIVRKNKSAFAGVRVIMNSDRVLDVALNKKKTMQFLGNGGVKVPRVYEINEITEDSYPLILKEEFGCGSHGVRVVHDKDELEEALGILDNPVIEQYVGSSEDEYTLTVFSDGVVTNSIAFKRTLGYDGMSKFVELEKDETIAGIGRKIAGLFELRGSFNIQMRKQDNEYYVFEINPRISSTIGFRSKLGFNDAAWWINMLEGKKTKKYSCPKGHVHGVRSVEEKIFVED